ncbi:MAG: HEAT repeat domain-containing protein, partial [Planctomycetota bacterium]
RTSLLGVWLLAGILPGCASVDPVLARAKSNESKQRAKALEQLEKWVIRARSGKPRYAPVQAKIDVFLKQRLTDEPSAFLRAQIIFLALQGEFSSVPLMLMEGARDGEAHVRLAAVKGMREFAFEGRKSLLFDLLKNDSDLFVRIEVTKTIAKVGSEDWAEPLVDVLLDVTQKQNLRDQAYLAARSLTDSQLPNLDEPWRQWLQERRKGATP